MKEDRTKINLHGKKISLLEAKIHLLGIKWDIESPNLNEEENRNYKEWKERIEKNKRIIEGILHKKYNNNISEKRYLVEMINEEITRSKREYCRIHGHRKKRGSKFYRIGIDEPYYICGRCDLSYRNKFPSKEEGDEPIHNPFVGPKDSK